MGIGGLNKNAPPFVKGAKKKSITKSAQRVNSGKSETFYIVSFRVSKRDGGKRSLAILVRTRNGGLIAALI